MRPDAHRFLSVLKTALKRSLTNYLCGNSRRPLIELPVRLLIFGAASVVCICSVPTLLAAQHVTGTVASTQTPPRPATSLEPRITVAPGLKSRSPALQDPRFAINAMGLTATQQQGLAQVRARYVKAIQSYVARLNAMEQGGVSRAARGATEDTLKAILTAEHVAADSLITPEQKQRYLNAMRQVHAASVINTGGSTASKGSLRSSAGSASVVPIP